MEPTTGRLPAQNSLLGGILEGGEILPFKNEYDFKRVRKIIRRPTDEFLLGGFI